MGEHSLKGIKGKEQIVQLLPATLAGRKFPPLVSSEAQKSHFEEQRSTPATSQVLTVHALSDTTHSLGISSLPCFFRYLFNPPPAGTSSASLSPSPIEEEEGGEGPTNQLAPAFARMRELSLAAPEGAQVFSNIF